MDSTCHELCILFQYANNMLKKLVVYLIYKDFVER